MNRRQSRRALLATVPAVLGAGCIDTLVSTPGNGSTEYDSCPESLDAVESDLCGLIEADDREDYAAGPHIHYDNGEVFVSLLLAEGAELPTNNYDLEIDEEYPRVVTAFMDIDQVIPLAKEANVLLITLRYVDVPPDDEELFTPMLHRLFGAKDRGKFTEDSSQFRFEGGKVYSDIAMKKDKKLDLKAHHITEYYDFGSGYQAWVKVDYLVPLARHENVLRIINRAIPDDD